MLNILVNAYAVSPSWGSEPGMGWNWITTLAKHSRVFVITEGEWRKEIEEAVAKLPYSENLKFYYNPVSAKVRKMCWNQGDWRFYHYYRKWQKKTLEIAREIIRENRIDVMHQLNMIGFREPGYLYKIEGIPLVWGPVGGLADTPDSMAKDGGLKMRAFIMVKKLISNLQLHFQPRVRKMAKRSVIIGATPGIVEAMKRIYSKEIPLINETGVYPRSAVIRDFKDSKELKVLWVGKFDFRKRLDLALKALAATGRKDIVLNVVGEGTDAQKNNYAALAKRLGIDGQVVWKGKIPHDEIEGLMLDSDLFFFTSIAEATSTVVLEAIQCGLPVLSLNACGFGPLVKGFAGIAVEMTDSKQVIKDFAHYLKYFANHREMLKHYSQAEMENTDKLSWDYKGRSLLTIYQQLADYKHYIQMGGGKLNSYRDCFGIRMLEVFARPLADRVEHPYEKAFCRNGLAA